MQLIGEGRQDKIEMTHCVTHENVTLWLNERTDGAFQWGHGRDAKIVTEQDMPHVAWFGPDVQARVRQWLEQRGPEAAAQAKISEDIHEMAMSQPGSLDARLAMLDGAAPGLKGEIVAFIDSILAKRGLVVQPTNTGSPTGRLSGYRPANAEELKLMMKSGLPVDPKNPPKVWDPVGPLAGPADQLRDVPDISPDMDLPAEREPALAEDIEEPEPVGVGVSELVVPPKRPVGRPRKER